MLAQTDEHVHYTELLFRAYADRRLASLRPAPDAKGGVKQ